MLNICGNEVGWSGSNHPHGGVDVEPSVAYGSGPACAWEKGGGLVVAWLELATWAAGVKNLMGRGWRVGPGPRTPLADRCVLGRGGGFQVGRETGGCDRCV